MQTWQRHRQVPHAAEPPAGPGLAHLSPFTAQSGQGALTPLAGCIVQAPNQAPGSDSPGSDREAEGQRDRGLLGSRSGWPRRPGERPEPFLRPDRVKGSHS